MISFVAAPSDLSNIFSCLSGTRKVLMFPNVMPSISSHVAELLL